MSKRTHLMDYRIMRWHSLKQLEEFLNQMTNEEPPWRADSHKLSGGEDDTEGWTIFVRYIEIKETP